MTQQQYTPVSWQDETTSQQGTLINAERLNQMQTAHHYADGLEEVDTVPTADPGVAYHKIVYCTADNTLYRWDGEAWTADIDDPTRELLEEHEADHNNPHQVTKSQVGLGNCDNTSDADKPISTATQTALNAKADKSDTYTKAQTDSLLGGKVDKQDSSAGMIAYTAEEGTEGSTEINGGAKPATIPIRTADGRLRAYFDDADPYADDCVTYTWTSGQLTDIRGTLDYKADKATTLAGYGISDAYTKTEADTLLGAKADQATTYTKGETDSLLAGKANASQLTDGSVTKVGTANVGDDTKPIKLVAGVPTAVTYDLAKDSEVVHLAGAETIPGAKTFTGGVVSEISTGETANRFKDTRFTRGETTASTYRNYLTFTDKNLNRVAIIGHEKKATSGTVNSSNTGVTNFYDATHYGFMVLYTDYDSDSDTYSNYARVSSRGYNAGSSYQDDIATIKTLDAYTPMVRTTGNQTIAGTKTFSQPQEGTWNGHRLSFGTTTGGNWYKIGEIADLTSTYTVEVLTWIINSGYFNSAKGGVAMFSLIIPHSGSIEGYIPSYKANSADVWTTFSIKVGKKADGTIEIFAKGRDYTQYSFNPISLIEGARNVPAGDIITPVTATVVPEPQASDYNQLITVTI